MTLNEILEEQSVKAISQKTNISEENIERIMAEDFSTLAKAKALGFISILERDYNADLTILREKALGYYEEYVDEESINIALPRVEEKRGRSKWFPFLMLGLLAYASWYFFTQFDKKMLGTILPFSEDKVETTTPQDVEVPTKTVKEEKVQQGMSETEESLSITNALTSTQTDATGAQTDIIVASIDPNESVRVSETVPQKMNKNTHSLIESTVYEVLAPKEVETIVLMPESRLWFGIIDMSTQKRDHFSISTKYEINVKEKSWLVATSSAPFSFINQEETQEFNDAKEHYFKVSKAGVESLSKSEYVSRGGYRKW
jgi:hypothetical protein